LFGVNCVNNQIDTFTTEGKALFESYFKTYVINNLVFDGITKINNGVFQNFNAFDKVSLSFGNALTEIGNDTFRDCHGIVGTLTIPNSCTKIGPYAFNNCTGLTGTLVIPNSLTSVNTCTFAGCTGLVGLDTSAASCSTIDSLAFNGCTNITGTLVIPHNLVTIESDAFIGCKFTNIINNNTSYFTLANNVGSAKILLNGTTSDGKTINFIIPVKVKILLPASSNSDKEK
jgi:hypothetical protein